MRHLARATDEYRIGFLSILIVKRRRLAWEYSFCILVGVVRASSSAPGDEQMSHSPVPEGLTAQWDFTRQKLPSNDVSNALKKATNSAKSFILLLFGLDDLVARS